MDMIDCGERAARTASREGTRRTANEEEVERLSVRPARAARMLGVSRSTIYDLLRAGQIRSRACGSARLVPVAELVRWLETDEDAA